MKFRGFIITAGLAVGIAACSQNGVENLKVTSDIDSLAYAIGVLNQVSAEQSELDIDPMMMAKGMFDMKDGKAIMNDAAARGYINLYMRKVAEEKNREKFQDVIDSGKVFLEENAKKEGVITTESGLQYKVITMGDGPKPKPEDEVIVDYKGSLIDGTVFESSYENGEPIKFQVQGVISGWTEGLQLMPVGSKFMFYIPYDLAYGGQQNGPQIKPFSTLIFEVELHEITTANE